MFLSSGVQSTGGGYLSWPSSRRGDYTRLMVVQALDDKGYKGLTTTGNQAWYA